MPVYYFQPRGEDKQQQKQQHLSLRSLEGDGGWGAPKKGATAAIRATSPYVWSVWSIGPSTPPFLPLLSFLLSLARLSSFALISSSSGTSLLQ